MHYFFKESSFSTPKHRSTKIVNFMTLREGFCARAWASNSLSKMHSFENLLLLSGVIFRQTKYIEMMIKEGSTKIVNFMESVAGVPFVGYGHI